MLTDTGRPAAECPASERHWQPDSDSESRTRDSEAPEAAGARRPQAPGHWQEATPVTVAPAPQARELPHPPDSPAEASPHRQLRAPAPALSAQHAAAA
jgi:hypothetical protein